jgi:hypothetical protein
MMDMAVDRSGSIYACCILWGRDDFTIAVVKYTSRGRVAWAREYEPGGDGLPWPTGIALDADGDAYVTGHAGTSAFVMSLAARNGALRWRWLSPDSGSYNPSDIVVTRSGTSFIAGADSRDTGNTAFLAAVSPSGEMKWLAKRTDPAGSSSGWFRIALARGSLYLAGWAGGELAAGRYTMAGGETWLRSWSPAGVDSSVGTGLATGADGSVYVAGAASAGGDESAVLVKWGPGGARKWARTVSGPWRSVRPYVIAGGAGDLYVTGGRNVLKYTTAGRAVWRWDLPAGEYYEVSDACLASTTSLFVAGEVGDRTLVAKLRR